MYGIIDHDRSGSRQVTVSKRHVYNPNFFTGHTQHPHPWLGPLGTSCTCPIDPRTSRPPLIDARSWLIGPLEVRNGGFTASSAESGNFNLEVV